MRKLFILKQISRQFCSAKSRTIFALSSGQGKCGVAVIRLSGPATQTALKSMTQLPFLPEPRKAVLKSIKHPITQETLDKGLVLWFPGPFSFTGEDCCEFHIHGGIATINAVLEALSSIPKVQLAQPGEFTKRAFYNGKLDLTEVEGLGDLLAAETEIQRKQAFLQTEGALSKVYHKWRTVLLKSVAHLEAHIDFEETETIDEGIIQSVAKNVHELSLEIKQHLIDGRKGELLRTGVKTVITGEPNVGKSSLLNLLCQRPAAIVTPIEGTTRDILEVTLNISGYPLVLTDTAGLRSETKDIIEKEGIERALKSFSHADLVILVIDSQKYINWSKTNGKTLTEYIKHYVKSLNLNNLINEQSDTIEDIFVRDCILVVNKIDLLQTPLKGIEEITLISCKNDDGIELLLNKITNKLKLLCGEPSKDHPSMNQARHRQHLCDCLENLNFFSDQINGVASEDIVILAEYLRRSLRHLGHLIGSTTTEQLLDVIFKDFCIGK